MFLNRGIILLILTAALWSTSGILVRSVNWSPVALASARGLVGALVMAVLLRKGQGFIRPRRSHFVAGMCLALLSICFVTALKLTVVANVIVLQYSAPLWVAVLAPLILKERTSGRDWLFMALILGGMVLFFMDGLSTEGFYGNILAIASGFFFGVQAMLLRGLKDSSPATALIVGNFMTFLLGLPFWGPPWPDLTGWGIVLVLGVFQYGLPYYLYSLAVPRVSSMEMVLVTMLEPILAPLWVFIWLGEKPGFWSLIGGGVVIFSVVVWSLQKARPKKMAID